MNLALAAVILPARWGLALTLLAVVSLTGLYFWHLPMPALARDLVLRGVIQPGITLGELGFVVAFASSATVISYFIARVTKELQERERDLRIAEQRRARSERLEALAAGAGHELASPLSTIAVIANDLSRHLEGTHVPPSVIEDVQLIRGELDHCRRILDRLASSAGQATGEAMHPIPIKSLVDDVVSGIRRKDRVKVFYEEAVGQQTLTVPRMGVAQAVRGIVSNSLDASTAEQEVDLRIRIDEGRWCCFEVVDRGVGMPNDVLERAGEPFFTTKETGKGMGLGVFLTRNVVERLGGQFRLESSPGIRTVAEIRLPLEPQ